MAKQRFHQKPNLNLEASKVNSLSNCLSLRPLIIQPSRGHHDPEKWLSAALCSLTRRH
jgi:hypothetical protein